MLKKFLFLLLVLFCSTSCGNFRYEVIIPKSDIQNAIEKQFPYYKNILLARISVHSPEVYFKSNKIGLKVSYKGNFLDKKAEGDANFTARITFNRKQGIFYLRDFEIVDATANGKNLSPNSETKKMLSDIINKKLNYYKLYKLEQSDIKQQITMLVVKKIYFKDDNLYLVLGL